MAQLFKSIVKRSTTAAHIPRSGSFRESITSRRPTLAGSEFSGLNSYMDESFFQNENFRSAIERLDGAYHVFTDLIEYMQGYQELLTDVAKLHKAFAKKWKSKVKQQLAIFSYHTTRRAHLQTIGSSESIVPHIEALCTAIAQVIADLQREVDRLYPNRGLGKSPKHYRSDELKSAFKSARATVKRLSEELDTLRSKAKKAAEEADQAALHVEQLQYASDPSKSKLAKATGHRTDKDIALKTLNERVARTEEELEKEQLIYREKAMAIFEKCQIYEQERLDLIRQTLMKFVQAMHSVEYSEEVDGVFADLLDEIKQKQNTAEDLRYWAETYGVTLEPPTVEEEVTETPVLQPAPEVPVEPAVPEATPVTETTTPTVDPTKTVSKKTKKKQNTAATEEVTPDPLVEESV